MFNRFAAGRKVYSSGSYAPTRGTVKPAGYIKRELRKRAKAKQKPVGQTVAAKALRHKLRTSR